MYADVVLAGVTPIVLAELSVSRSRKAPGSQVKMNLMLRRFPRLRDDSVTPEQAFGGTFHINETFSQLDTAYTRAEHGVMRTRCRVRSTATADRPEHLVGQLRESGAQTLTVFGLHTPHGLIAGGDPDRMRDAFTCGAQLDEYRSGRSDQVVLIDDSGGPVVIETKTTADLEQTLWMTGGNIFHGALAWPFAEDDEPLDTPARRWGVATAHDRIMLCGSGSRRGGRCRASAATTPRWRCWRVGRRSPGSM